MVEAIIKYKASDGSVWDSPKDAEYREKLTEECNWVEAAIGKRPKLEQGTFKQHNLEDFYIFRSQAIAIAKKYLKEWNEKWNVSDEQIHPLGIIGRILNDSNELFPIDRIWNRWACIDKKGREWDQPYFAIQADKT